METKIQEIDDKMVVMLKGELDTSAAAEVESKLSALFDNESKDVVFDCTELDYIASSGLRIILGILKKSKASGHTVTMKNVNDDIMNVFKMTGFNNLFEFE